jgi:hypothetical protein
MFRFRRSEQDIEDSLLTVWAADILTLGEDGLVAYVGMELPEIVAYGWVKHDIDLATTPDGAPTHSVDEVAPGIPDAYQEYLQRREQRTIEYSEWDPDDPDPRNPWNQDEDPEEDLI